MEQSDVGREGIRGWLFLFCLSLTVLGPLVTFGGLANLYYQMRRFFDIDDGLRGAFAVYAFTTCVLTIFGAYAGFRMWRKQVEGVKLARLFILGAMAFAWISPFIWIIGVEKAEFYKVMGSFLGSAVGVTVICLIWYAYLHKSKRVLAIYLTGPNRVGPAQHPDTVK
jgi:hypothetical protein